MSLYLSKNGVVIISKKNSKEAEPNEEAVENYEEDPQSSAGEPSASYSGVSVSHGPDNIGVVCLPGKNIVYKSDVLKEMSLQEIVDILAYPDLNKISSMPAIKPRGGSVYVYRCPDNDSRHDIRADQYVWCQQGTRKMPKDNPVLKRFYMYLRTAQPIPNIHSKRAKKTFAKYDVRFMKIEYEFIDAEDPLVLVHYVGDETVWKPFRHGNSVKNNRPFVRTMKSAVKRRVLELGAVTSPKEVCKAMMMNSQAEPGYEAVTAPRDKQQIRNYLKKANVNRSRSKTNSTASVKPAKRRRRAETPDSADDFGEISDIDNDIPVAQTYVDPYDPGCVPIDAADDDGVLTGVDSQAKFYPLFPTFEICHTGGLGGFVNSMALLPQVTVTLANKNVLDMVDELIGLDTANKADRLEFYYVSAGPLTGGYYLSTLLFRHCLFESEPIVPAAYLIHERKSVNDHKRLFEMLKVMCPEVERADCVFITDREFGSIQSILPSAIHLFSWHYIVDDVVNWVESNGGTNDDANRFTADLYALMRTKTVERFNRELNIRRRSWPTSFVNFFENWLKEDILDKGARWHSAGLGGGVFDSYNGVSIPPCNNLNQLVGDLVDWQEATLEQLIQCLYYFSDYYSREIERSIYQLGKWKLQQRYVHFAKSVANGRLRPMAPFELGRTNNIVNHVRSLANSERDQEEVVMTGTKFIFI